MPRISPSSEVNSITESLWVGDRFILTDSVIVNTRFGSSQSTISLEITNITSLTRVTSAILPKKILKRSWLIHQISFMAHVTRIFYGSCYSDLLWLMLLGFLLLPRHLLLVLNQVDTFFRCLFISWNSSLLKWINRLLSSANMMLFNLDIKVEVI